MRYLTDLFAGAFPGHAIVMDHGAIDVPSPGDFAISDRPVEDWVAHYVAQYEARVAYHEALGDDAVPYVNLTTNTGVFAAAFGCPMHEYAAATPAAARPVVTTAAEAEALGEPSLEAPTLARIFAMAERMRRELGDVVPISVPDIQSPFDIAALIWNKEDFFVALHTDPDAAKRLIDRCTRLLTRFLVEYKARVGNVNMCHCPNAWAPPDLGIWLSEDEAATYSERAQAMQDQDMEQRLQTTEGMCYGLRRDR